MSGTPLELKSEIVRAGAGAGKTRTLSLKVLEVAAHCLSRHERKPHIIVTTFTKKATEELRERLLKYAFQGGEPANTYSDKLKSQLMDTVTSPAHLHISTIHGVLSLFLRRYGHLVGVDSQFKVLEEHVAFKHKKRLLREFLRQNEVWAQAITGYTVDDLLGILQTLEEAFARNSEPQPAGYEFLVKVQIEQQTKQLKELQKIVGEILSSCADEKNQTYFSAIDKYLKIALSQSNILAEGHWLEFQENLGRRPSFSKSKPPFSPALQENYLEALKNTEKWFENAVSSEDLLGIAEKNSLFTEMAGQWSQKWRDYKLKSGQLEMSDLELVTFDVLSKEPSLARSFEMDWDYWLIDEFQDTSPLQIQLIEMLRGSRAEFLVGDPQQSIYLFRGARSDIFDEREKQFISERKSTSSLLKNYRSSPELLEFFNDFFARLPGNFRRMQPKEPTIDPLKKVARFLWVDKKNEEPYAPIFHTIRELVDRGEKLEDICILGRRNADLMLLAQDLESWGVPVRLHSTEGFFQRREIVDALSLLKFLLNPHDNENFVRLLRTPYFRVEDAVLAAHIKSSSVSFWNQFQTELNTNSVIQKLQLLYSSSENEGIVGAWLNGLIRHGYFDWCADHDTTGRREANLWKLVSGLQESCRTPGFSIADYLQNAFSLNDQGLQASDAVAALEPNRVQLMTVHKAKGLDFKHVIIPNIHKNMRGSLARSHREHIVFDEPSNTFTISNPREEDEKVKHSAFARARLFDMDEKESAESLRVLYVALTRAVESVTLHGQWPAEAKSWGSFLSWAHTPGVFCEPNYTYEVKMVDAPPEKLQWPTTKSKTPRSLWLETTANVKLPLNSKRLSVTKLLAERADNDSASKTVNRNSDSESKTHQIQMPVFGMQLHRALEALRHNADVEQALGSNVMSEEDKSKIRQAIQFVQQAKELPMQILLQTGQVEWGFQVATRLGVIEGQIDLWGVVDGDVWLVDYKSGKSSNAELAFEQLEVYAYAVRRFGVQGRFHLAVVYALEQKIKLQRDVQIHVIQEKFGF